MDHTVARPLPSGPQAVGGHLYKRGYAMIFRIEVFESSPGTTEKDLTFSLRVMCRKLHICNINKKCK